jgi:hypothetical protein
VFFGDAAHRRSSASRSQRFMTRQVQELLEKFA